MNESWFATTKNFVKEHKTTIFTLALVTTVTVAAVQQAGLKQHDKFLKEHDLYDTYYTPDMD